RATARTGKRLGEAGAQFFVPPLELISSFRARVMGRARNDESKSPSGRPIADLRVAIRSRGPNVGFVLAGMMLSRILILIGPLPGVDEGAGFQKDLSIRPRLGERVQIGRIGATMRNRVHLRRLG